MKKYVKCLIESEDKGILLIQRSSSDEHGSMWETPGGGVDDGETLVEAVIREVKEETGLDVSVEMDGTMFLSDDADPEMKFEANLFSAKTTSGEVSLVQNDDHSDHAWVKREDLFPFMLDGNQIDRWTLSHIIKG